MKAGIYPPPVYVAVTQDGAEHRFSFWSPAGKPIDFARGRRAVESLLLTNEDCSPRVTVRSRAPYTSEHAQAWRGQRWIDHGSIVAGFVEHDSIGRVAHTAQDVAPKAIRINWAKRAKDAREAIAAGNLSVAMSLLNAA